MSPKADPSSKQVTKLLRAINDGEEGSWERLLTLVYDELRQLAGRRMRGERKGHTLQRTALVNEAAMKLLQRKGIKWRDRGHFFAASAEAMRRILVDYARRRKTEKRGGDADRVPLDVEAGLDDALLTSEKSGVDLEAVDSALAKLEQNDKHAEKAAIVKLRYFAGLTVEETALAIGKSTAQVKRDWCFAKAWLYREIQKG